MTTPTPHKPRNIADLDRPLAQVEADAKRLNKKTPAEVLRKAMAKTASESDRIAYANDLYLLAHPEACSSDDDYPDWVVAEWNRLHAVGTAVLAFPGTRDGRSLKTRTRSEAWVMGGHTAVVLVDGYPGCIALTHIDPTGGAA